MTRVEEGVYVIDSKKSGPCVSIIGGIHGNEPCGIKLLEFMKKDISLKRGKIYLLSGNLDALSRKVRQCDVNLNRIFRAEKLLTQEEKKSQEFIHMQRIKKYLNMSDACLDIHSSPTKGSPVFIICEDNCFDVIKHFPISRICSGFSDIEPGGTDYYMYKRGKIGICVECGYHQDPKAFRGAKQALYCFLEYFGIRAGKVQQNLISQKIYLQAKRAYLTQSSQYIPIRQFVDFEKIDKGMLLGHDQGLPIYAESNGNILFSRSRDKIGVEAFVELISL